MTEDVPKIFENLEENTTDEELKDLYFNQATVEAILKARAQLARGEGIEFDINASEY